MDEPDAYLAAVVKLLRRLAVIVVLLGYLSVYHHFVWGNYRAAFVLFMSTSVAGSYLFCCLPHVSAKQPGGSHMAVWPVCC